MIYNQYNFNFYFQIFIIFLLLLFIQNCAVIKAPSGGPKDTTPPYIIEIDPPSGSLNYKGEKIILKFSEYMNSKSIEKGIRIFPNITDELPILINGDMVTIDFPNDLDKNQTYVINLSRNIMDEHGVELADAIFLAYSTGKNISKGSISGVVYGEGKSAVHLWKIKDNSNFQDIVFTYPPNYITDVSNKGLFDFQYLSKGDYFILSLDRNFAGMHLNKDRMAYGLNWNKIISLQSDEVLSNVNMFKGKFKSQLKLLSGEWYGTDWGRMNFNLSLKNINKDYILKIIYDEKESNDITSFVDPEDDKSLIFMDSSLNKVLENFQMIIKDLYIDDNTHLDSSSLIFYRSQNDTSLIKLTSPESNTKIAPNNSNEMSFIELKYSKPIPISKQFEYLLFKNDSVQVKEKTVIVNPMQVNISPEENWDARSNYLLIINDDSLQDSTIRINISTLNYTRYGGLQIPITGLEISSFGAELQNIENRELKMLSFVNSEKKIVFEEIPEGEYLITIFNDINNDEQYNFGKVKPFEPAEWFYVLSDTIEIRGNWDIELPIINIEEVYK